MNRLTNIAIRVAQLILVIVLVTFGITVLIRMLPYDPIRSANPFMTQEEAAKLSHQLGLDRSNVGYYWSWLKNVLHGDLGSYYNSSSTAESVTSRLAPALPVTLQLVFYTTFIALFFAIPIGIYQAYRADKVQDRLVSNVMFSLSAIPNYALGLGLSLIFGLWLRWVEPLGYIHFTDSVTGHFKQMALPVASLAVGQVATYARLLRVDVISNLKEDYVRMAASKGLSNRYILWRHVLRPSSLALVTTAALNMGALIGGTVVIESLFNLEGVGFMLQQAVLTRQYLVVQSLVAVTAIAYVLLNLAADAVNSAIDPRARSRRG